MAEVVGNSENQASDAPEIDEATQAAVRKWAKKIKNARAYWEKKTFKQMRECIQLARDGADKTWVASNKFVVPIINRHINQAVAQLYAKNPKAYAERKRRRMNTVWDGTITSLQEAQTSVAQAQASRQQSAGAGVAPTMPPDPNALAIIQDATQVKQYDVLMDGMAETMTLLHNHFMCDKAAQYKQHFKALVRRTKVCCVGYVKLGLQRVLEPNVDATAKATDISEQIARIERLTMEQAEVDPDSPDVEELRTMLADLQSQAMLIVQEGPILTFPKSTAVIVDTDCTHLKTLTGADWWAEEMDLTPDKIEEVFKVDVKKGGYEKYETQGDNSRPRDNGDGEGAADKPARVWLVQCRSQGQEFVLCDGYNGWLKPPGPPDVKISRFFNIFPLVFNETESADEENDNIFPPSDVWQARHIQKEFNRKKDAVRAHRISNTMAYIGSLGAWEPTDAKKLQDHESGELILLKQLAPTQKITDVLQAKPTIPLDPALYEVESDYMDLQRTVGTQQADLGGTSGDTATETSIAAQSRSTSMADNVDDLDDMLSLLAHSTGELMLRELSLETVQRIVGPGAVWPQDQDTREEIIEDITLDIRAGSSGRPNQAAEIAKFERAMPSILQLPGVNPTPIAERYFDLLEVDAEDAIVEGLPSITAVNAMAGRPAVQPGTGDPSTNPGDQGAHGASNAGPSGQQAQQTDNTMQNSQPAFPSPVAPGV